MKEPQEGKHWYYGRYSPYPLNENRAETFSVGIFRWMKKASGKGFKRSPVVYRVRGDVEFAKLVYDRAAAICRAMDDGYWGSRKKSETI